MKKTILSAIAIALVAPGIGCATLQQSNEQQIEVLRPRAAFEMRCAGDELTFTPLADVNGMIYQYGVEGCGQRAVYVRQNPGSGPWYANSVSIGSVEEDARRRLPTESDDPELFLEDYQDPTD